VVVSESFTPDQVPTSVDLSSRLTDGTFTTQITALGKKNKVGLETKENK
jgi:hypothetical protein